VGIQVLNSGDGGECKGYGLSGADKRICHDDIKAVDGPTVKPDAITRPVESSISAATICVLKKVKGAASGSPENVRTPLDTVALGFNN